MDEGLLPGETPGIYKPRPNAKSLDYGVGLIAPCDLNWSIKPQHRCC